MERTIREKEILNKVLLSRAFQNLIGAEEWDLTEDEENILWNIISRIEGASGAEKDPDT